MGMPELLLVAGVLHELRGAPRQIAAGHRAMAEHVSQALAVHVASFGNRHVGSPAMGTVIAAVFDQRNVRAFGTKYMVRRSVNRTIKPVDWQ
ncbi:MAG TPA: hypothetical protein VFU80_05000 [Sphingomicrobium sp.]|nr:hypothetical protein [Sphingomicrobium sp.]